MDHKNIEKANKILSLVYYVVYFAAVLSAVLGYYSTFKGNLVIDSQSQLGITLSSIFIIYIIGSIPLTLAGFHFLTKKWIKLESQPEKIDKYRKYAVWRLVIIGISIAIGVFLFYIIRSQSMIFCAGIAAIALFFCKPTKEKMISELQLFEEE